MSVQTATSCVFKESHFCFTLMFDCKMKKDSNFTTAKPFACKKSNIEKHEEVGRESQKQHHWNSQSRNTSVPTINSEEYRTQVSEETEVRALTNCPRSSAGRSPAFQMLSKLDEFLLNPEECSGNIPEHRRVKPETKRRSFCEGSSQ